MNIYLIRHGRQASTLCNVDVPLSKVGERQAQLLRKRMRQYPVDALYTSDLTRAVQTAQIVFADSEELLEQRMEREELREFDFGSLTGVTNQEVGAFYSAYYENAKKNLQDIPVCSHDRQAGLLEMAYPEGENGEQVYARVQKVLQEIIAGDKENVAVITHGGVIRVLMTVLFGRGVEGRLLFGASLENCGITQIFYDEDKKLFYLDRFNDYTHLEGTPRLLRRNW